MVEAGRILPGGALPVVVQNPRFVKPALLGAIAGANVLLPAAVLEAVHDLALAGRGQQLFAMASLRLPTFANALLLCGGLLAQVREMKAVAEERGAAAKLARGGGRVTGSPRAGALQGRQSGLLLSRDTLAVGQTGLGQILGPGAEVQ
jgi:hypothetical protein